MDTVDPKVWTLLALGVIMLAAWTVGSLVSRIGQPRVIGEIIAGILLGPSLLGLLAPSASTYLFPASVVTALGVLAQVGLVLFMFMIGLELDFGRLRGHGRRLASVAVASIVVPLGLAVVLALVLHPTYGDGEDKLVFCLFFGAAMAITAFPVLARLLQESGLAGTRIGTLSLVSAAVNDVVAWCLLAFVISLSRATGAGDGLRTLLLAVVYVVAMLGVVRPLLARLTDVPIWLALVIALLAAWFADRAGIHVIFGGFMAGAVMPRRAQWQRSLHERLDLVVTHVLLPVFFVMTGLSTHVEGLRTAGVWGVVVLVIAVATVGKLGGTALTARAVGERWSDALTLGVLMNTRGLTELVVLSIGLQLGIISSTMFTVMVLMALVTTLMAPPLLRLIEHRSTRSAPARTREPLEATAG
ncbi:cation:proton antiporter [Streptomyces sp. NL15-2K]|uniref:cation:proton antiporter n=1 Tax=Streptomyces sp. NL15-2K TaxID=376149 RepID=UPI000F58D726|nr:MULTISPECIES: cation:proton antiporter [Actinomycetes]WKX14204.1 cation:proton antiporter [Kutzneria buriramensis]GCB44636.1 sodium/hydrogen exchanger [Streptomyces sp. NL15-2K]